MRLKAFLLVLFYVNMLSACGGSDDSPSATLTVNASSLSFAAASPYEEAPSGQAIIASVSGEISGTLYVVVKATGEAVENVSNISVTGNSGQGTVKVRPPILLGAGTFSSAITIRACINDATCSSGELAGSPKTINVSYSIAALTPSDTVMPHIITAGIAGQVAIRGAGLSNVTGVNFGSTSAASFKVISDTLILATYPETLGAGSYAVSLSGTAIPFDGAVVAVGAQKFPAAKLSIQRRQRESLRLSTTRDERIFTSPVHLPMRLTTSCGVINLTVKCGLVQKQSRYLICGISLCLPTGKNFMCSRQPLLKNATRKIRATGQLTS